MNDVNKTLYIPLYGKAYVSKKNIILQDKKAESIWQQAGFELKGKSKSKWLAYYMAMRSAVYDEWVKKEVASDTNAIVLHIGCGLDGRIVRIRPEKTQWYDVDFPEVIDERRKYYTESECYHMVAADVRTQEWKKCIEAGQDAIIIMEGVSMYLKPEELMRLFSDFSEHFKNIKILMDVYSEKAAKASKYKNPINDVGVTQVYGYDNPQALAEQTSLLFKKEYEMTPQKYIDELNGMEKNIFEHLYAGKIAKSMYRMYEFQKTCFVKNGE